MLRAMSRQIWLACVLAGLTGSSGCSKSAGNQEKDTGPSGPEKIAVPGGDRAPVPVDHGPGGPAKGGATDDPRFHLHPEEGTLTVDKAEGKAGAELVAEIKVAPATGLHLSTDYPIKLTLEPTDGLKLAKVELTAGGRDKSKGDADTLSEKQLAFSIKATADKAGAYEIKGVFKFGVCDKDSCHPKKQPITIAVAAN
jgi:hypothetical protein